MHELKYARILRAVMCASWAIVPNRLDDIVEVLAFQAQGGKLSAEEMREYVGLAAAGPSLASVAPGGVGVVGLRGIINHRMEQVDNISGPGGTSVEGFRERFRHALASDQVGSILLDVDSPGGNVDGVEELAAEVFASRGEKPIVAVANTMAGSAAYYIASQADELVVTPSGQVGSIGVFAAHEDISEALAEEGRKITLISAGRFKVEGNPFEPLTEEAMASIQQSVDGHYDAFVDAVARGRGVKASAVRNGFGEGRVVAAKDAVAEGMADRVETLEQTAQRLPPELMNSSVGGAGRYSQSRSPFTASSA